jgi:hypothetical protein
MNHNSGAMPSNNTMKPSQKNVIYILLAMALITFILFSWPNSAASQNLAMVQMFQPDEATPLPYVFHMIAPAENINQALRSFVFYEFYYYGFPYFGLSAALLLPLQWLGQITNISLDLLILRQLASVLPMLAALLLLVFMQDGFRTYRSVVLFAILLCVPAVVRNNLWWHPDGISFLLVVLTLFFLQRDKLRFGRNFLFAAAMAGISTATKLAGVYFFLAIALTLFLGFYLKKASWKRMIGMSVAFLFVMALSFLIANPFLLSHWARTAYGYIFQKQTFLLSEGYGVVYEKGFMAAWPLIREYFGQAVFLLVAIGAAIWGARRGPQRLLHGLILAWFLPITILVLFVTHFKFQYWLPVALPLFSSLITVLPEKWNWNRSAFKAGFVKTTATLTHILILLIIMIQATLYVKQDAQMINGSLHQVENNPRIQFYDQALVALSPLPATGLYHVYYDYRLYVPETSGWTSETTYDLLEYGTIQEKNFDILLLLEQRIRDYLNPNVTGIDPQVFARNQQFYHDADTGQVINYHLVYRNDVALVYVRDDLYEQYFQK